MISARRSVLTLCMSALLGSAAWSPAWGQSVYRCGSSYSEQPCPGGQAVGAADARTAEQRGEAQRAAVRDARLADGMERDRRRAESRAEREAARERQARARTERERAQAREAQAGDGWPAEPFVARVPAQPRPPKDGPRRRD